MGLLRHRRWPRRRVGESPWRPLRLVLGVFVSAIVYGTVGFILIERWEFLDAFYLTLLTLSGVGFPDVRGLEPAGKIFTISVLLSGLMILLFALTMAAGVISQRGFGERTRRRRMHRRFETMRNHYVVCAYGRVGRAVARQFEEEGVPFIIIEKDVKLETRMQEDGVDYVIGDPTMEEVLKLVGIERAKAIVCAVDSDADNVYIALAARSLNESIYIVARAARPESADRLRRAGADRVISPYVNSGRHMAVLASQPRLTDYIEVEAGPHTTLRVDEVILDKGSELVGKRLSEALEGKTPLALRRATGELVTPPHPDLTFAAGDVLFLLRELEAWRRD